MNNGDSLKVYVADRSPAVLERLAAMLAQIPDVEVVGQVSNLGGVLDAFAQLDPEVVIIDAHLPGGIEVLRSIKREKPATVMVMLIDVDYPQYRSRLHSAGANKVLDISNELPRLEKLVVKLAGEPWRRPAPDQLKADPAPCGIGLRWSNLSPRNRESDPTSRLSQPPTRRPPPLAT